MHRYRLEQRIHSLADNLVGYVVGEVPSFEVEGVTFSPWLVTREDSYWTHPYWLASVELEAQGHRAAWEELSRRLNRLITRISVVSQCYMDYLQEPLLIHRKDSEVAFLKWVSAPSSVSLMFREEEREALNLLLKNSEIPEAFYYYWNDATNSTGYASKLMLMIAAVEALVKIPHAGGRPVKDWDKLELILGLELKTDLWGTEKDSKSALRHRLMHGEYFQPKDDQKDYLSLLHKRVIAYFNSSILKCSLLSEDVTYPQRHPLGIKYVGHSFVRARGNARLKLVDLMEDMKQIAGYEFTNYERIVDDELRTNY